MLFVGIDGGGTKTDAVLFDEKGCVLERVKGGPSSPTNLTPPVAARNIAAVMEKLLENHGGIHAEIESFFAGLSGGGVGNNSEVMREYLMKIVPNCEHLHNYNDAINALRCVFPEGDAMIAISGTGSSVFACVEDKMYQVGGWGYLLGDEGSGFDLGQRALLCALRQLDGRGEATSMTNVCREKLGKDVTMAIPQLYAAGKAGIADFATVTLFEAEKGDRIALQQMQESAMGLAEAIRTAGKKIQDPIKRVATAGSIWKSNLFKDAVQQHLGEDYVLCSTDLAPVYGSCVIALKNAGIRITDEIENNFRKTLKQPVEIA